MNVWIKRIGYIIAAVLSFVAMGVVLEIITIYMEAQRYSFIVFVLNEYTGPIVMASFVVILFFIGLSMFFIYRAFSTFEDEIPV